MAQTHTRHVRTLLNLVAYLKSRAGVPLAELATLFGMTSAQMEHLLLTEVIVCGVPPYSPSDYLTVFVTDSPKGKRVTLHQHEEFRRPVRLTSVEALALKTVVELHTRARDAQTRAVADSLLEKISNASGAPLKAHAGRGVVAAPWSNKLRAMLAQIDAATSQRRVVEIEYYSAAHGRLSRRKVHPYALFEEGSRFYLRAWCTLRNAERSFRVDRIRAVDTLAQTFSVPRTQRRSARSVPGWDGTQPTGELVVRFEPFAADEVEQEWIGHGAQVTHEKDGGLLFRIPLYSPEWALGWVLSFGVHAELLAPASLRATLVERAKLMLQRV